jgi:hypothetical protein
MAFLCFAQQKVDAAVIEVGLGGRLDATNVVVPRVSVITSLSYDHMAVLGNTLTLIAGEKAGIIKPGIPVVSAPQVDEARVVLEKISAERRSALTMVGRDVQVGFHPTAGQIPPPPAGGTPGSERSHRLYRTQGKRIEDQRGSHSQGFRGSLLAVPVRGHPA